MRWLEENWTDARVGLDWLFDYTSLFKSINVSSGSLSRSVFGSKNVSEDEDEEVVYRPPTVSFQQPEGETPASPEGESFTSPEGESSDQPNSPESKVTNETPDADATPLTPVERERESSRLEMLLLSIQLLWNYSFLKKLLMSL